MQPRAAAGRSAEERGALPSRAHSDNLNPDAPLVIDPEVIIVPVVFGVPGLVLLVKMYLGYRERMAERNSLALDAAREIMARLDRLEQGLDALAVETERIGEGQRFTTRLLSERVPERASS